MANLKLRDLPVSSQLALWWSFVWRGFVTTLAAAIAGAVFGGIFGFAVGLAVSISGGSRALILPVSQLGGSILGGAAGLFMFYVYIRWLLSARLGQFRLLLVRAADAEEASTPSMIDRHA